MDPNQSLPQSPMPVAPAPMQPSAMLPVGEPKSHASLFIVLAGLAVLLVIAICGYLYVLKSQSDTMPPTEAAVLDPEVAALDATLGAESLGELGSELQSIDQELVP